ncbi:MAG TPA: chromosome partitioning protein ParB, partial [Burkholderiaceae bacterium]|nr:chromosome partitioning protein ParB [Burkholderiaceae bacterium]
AASNLLRLLGLAEPVQQMLLAGDIDMGHARALLALDKAHQITHASQVVARKLSVRETERLVARAAGGNGRQQPLLRVKQSKSRDVAGLEEELSDLLTATVDIRLRKRGRPAEQGEVAIAFASLDELNGLVEKLRRAGR